MPEIIAKAGPWDMTVYVFAGDDPANPLKNLTSDMVNRLPFGALELNDAGIILTHVDTEPGDVGRSKEPLVGKNFFKEIGIDGSASSLESEFRNGVSTNNMNTVFDCAVANLPYKVRIHLKISPILATYWVFIKRLKRLA